MDIGVLASVASAVIAVIAALISWINLQEYRRVEMHQINFDLLTKAEECLLVNPKLLELHSISEDDLQDCGVNTIEFVYILANMRAAQALYVIRNKSRVDVSPYRKNLLKHPKVQKTWTNLLQHRFITNAPFIQAVNKHIASQKQL